MTDEHHAEQPEQWARELWLTTFVCATATHPISDNAAALTIQLAFAAREADLVGALGKLAKYVDYLPHPHCVDAEQVIRQALKSREASHG